MASQSRAKTCSCYRAILRATFATFGTTSGRQSSRLSTCFGTTSSDSRAETQASKGPIMKAVRIHAFGGPEVVTYDDIPQPVPKAHEVLLKVTSTCVNYADVQWRLGNYVDRTLPATLGREAAGIIAAVGPGVTTLQAGQPILARAVGGHGANALTRRHNVLPRPTGLAVAQAG